jgi:hypothetical protein
MKDNSGKQANELAASNSAVQKLLLHAEINPRTLQNSCRLVILRSFVIGKNTNYISQLGLPCKIVKYIFSQCWDRIIFCQSSNSFISSTKLHFFCFELLGILILLSSTRKLVDVSESDESVLSSTDGMSPLSESSS